LAPILRCYLHRRHHVRVVHPQFEGQNQLWLALIVGCLHGLDDLAKLVMVMTLIFDRVHGYEGRHVVPQLMG
jgi:hypothetical protein